MILLLLACTRTDCAAEEPVQAALGVSTADPLFSKGGLAVGDRSAWACPAFGTSADTVVRAVNGVLYSLDRDPAAGDVVTAFDPLDLRNPLWQVNLGTRKNAHDLVGIGERLYLPLFDGGEIAVLDAIDGSSLPSISVPGQAPALDRAVVVDGMLWVADQRLDRTTFASSAGVLLHVHPERGVLRTIPAGSNPRLVAGRSADELLVATGLFDLGGDDIRRHDGVLRSFDVRLEEWSEPLLTESELDADLHVVTVIAGQIVTTVVDGDSRSRVHCLGVGDGPEDSAWFVAAAPLGDEVVIAARSSLAGPDELSDRGLFMVDPATCTRTTDIPGPDRDPYDVVSIAG